MTQYGTLKNIFFSLIYNFSCVLSRNIHVNLLMLVHLKVYVLYVIYHNLFCT